jgi:hypothetical protein
MKAIATMPVVQGFRCDRINPRCRAVHFSCPYCKEQGSVSAYKVTSIFYVICDNNNERHRGKEFLVDARLITEYNSVTV